MSTSEIYYVYEHWRLDRDECFYVGKGRGGRAYSIKDRNRHHKAIVTKLNRTGSAFEVRMVAIGLSEEEAFALERDRIKFWREANVDLTNLTDGGEGISGFRHTEETRKTLSEKNKGKPAAFKGRKHSEKTKAILSALGKKRGAPKLNDEQKAKVAVWHRGKKRSQETCRKIAEKAKGRVSPFKGKTSPMRGKQLSGDVKQKMSEAAKMRWQKRRMEQCL